MLPFNGHHLLGDIKCIHTVFFERNVSVSLYGYVDFMPGNGLEDLKFMSFDIEAEEIHPGLAVGQ